MENARVRRAFLQVSERFLHACAGRVIAESFSTLRFPAPFNGVLARFGPAPHCRERYVHLSFRPHSTGSNQ